MEKAASVEVCICHSPGSKLCGRACYKGCRSTTAVVTLGSAGFLHAFSFLSLSGARALSGRWAPSCATCMLLLPGGRPHQPPPTTPSTAVTSRSRYYVAAGLFSCLAIINLSQSPPFQLPVPLGEPQGWCSMAAPAHTAPSPEVAHSK